MTKKIVKTDSNSLSTERDSLFSSMIAVRDTHPIYLLILRGKKSNLIECLQELIWCQPQVSTLAFHCVPDIVGR